jgi:hypothetical protein
VAILLIAIGVAALAAAIGMWLARSRSAPAATPSTIENQKVVTLTGTVRVIGEPLVAPLSARTCVVYESYANLWQVNDAGVKALETQLADKKMVPFELETQLGSVIVDGAIAELELLPRPVFPRRPEREAAFLRSHGHEAKLIHKSDFEEITIDPGALVAVQGVAVVDAEQTIRIVGNDDHPLTIGPPHRTVVEVA